MEGHREFTLPFGQKYLRMDQKTDRVWEEVAQRDALPTKNILLYFENIHEANVVV